MTWSRKQELREVRQERVRYCEQDLARLEAEIAEAREALADARRLLGEVEQ